MVNIIDGFIKYSFYYIWVANLIFIFLIILIEKRNPLYTIFWTFLLLIFPYFGFLIYLFFGISFRKERLANKIYNIKWRKSNKNISTLPKEKIIKWSGLFTFVEMTSKNSVSANNNFDIYYEGKAFFESLFKEINNAKSTIFMEYYIFNMDNIGKSLADLLIKKASEGVKVILIVDGMNNDNRKLLKNFKDTGVEINFFFRNYFPIFNLRINYRNHRKISIIDSKIAFIGGMNIGDEYISENWRDTSVKVLGEVVFDIEREFIFSLGIVRKKILLPDDFSSSERMKLDEEMKKNLSVYSQVVSSGPNYEFLTLRDSFLKMIQEAKKNIYIQTPYFVPDDSLSDTLKTAILSGIEVNIMIPNKTDHFFMYWVNQYYAGEFLKLGANIYRYEKGFLHSKNIIIDDEVVSVGTCNIDYRSFYLNFEINLNIYDEEIARSFKNQFYLDTLHSEKLNLDTFEKRSVFSRIIESIFRLLSPIL